MQMFVKLIASVNGTMLMYKMVTSSVAGARSHRGWHSFMKKGLQSLSFSKVYEVTSLASYVSMAIPISPNFHSDPLWKSTMSPQPFTDWICTETLEALSTIEFMSLKPQIVLLCSLPRLCHQTSWFLGIESQGWQLSILPINVFLLWWLLNSQRKLVYDR